MFLFAFFISLAFLIFIFFKYTRTQSIPIFTTVDQNERERYLKYTPEHMHCTATFYGPLVPPNTGILAYQKANR